jgi:FAD/FMN-containing dehydrogenase
VPASASSLVAALERIVGPSEVLTDAAAAGYGADWTGRFGREPLAVVRPGDVDEVAAVVAVCRRGRVALVPQGGNTGLVGGGVPGEGAVVVSLRRLDGLGPVDLAAAQVTAGAGVTLERLRDAARAAGLRFGVDLAARGAATIGGMVATNAGGLHVLAHGTMRAQVLGVEAVLGDGSVVSHLTGLEKDNTGYDLAALLCGSEGTLGVVTAARLRLLPAMPETAVALLGVGSLDQALAVARRVRGASVGLEAAEVFWADGLDLVCAHLGTAPPFATRPEVYLLLEAAGRSDPTDALAAAVEGPELVTEVAVATDTSRRAELWRYREGHTDALAPHRPHKLDVTVPLGRMARFVDDVRAVVTRLAPHARCWLFGHLLDGNLHVNVTGIAPDDDRVDEAVLTLVAGHGGSISAEHGIGRAKVRWLHLSRSPAEIAAMRAVKQALDPDAILNPGVLLPPG